MARARSSGCSLNYVLQSLGELLIMPVGYAMIGKLAPKQYQGVMMGSWMLVTGLASLFAGDFSGMIPEPAGTTAVATNPEYAKLFAELGAGSLAVGIALVVLIPFLRKLITDKAETRSCRSGHCRSRRVTRSLESGRRGDLAMVSSPSRTLSRDVFHRRALGRCDFAGIETSTACPERSILQQFRRF